MTSGDFCGIPGSYTLYFAARFSTPFVASGTWENGAVSSSKVLRGHRRAWTAAPGSGFRRPDRSGRQKVLAKVGVSFVSAAGAAANLLEEDPGWDVEKISDTATAEWNGLLGRVAVQGGTEDGPAHLLHGALPLAAVPLCLQR